MSSELGRLIVDEIDDHKRKKEEQQQIEEIIEEERGEEDTEMLNRLRVSLGRLEAESQYLNKSKQQDIKASHSNSEKNSEKGS